jgi:pimeloyl-ACP methyl ester carboxylesterase
VFHSWIDRWDERRARRGDASKEPTDLVLDAELAFPSAPPVSNIAAFCELADQAAADPTFFNPPPSPVDGVEWRGGWIAFPSSLPSGLERNDTVRAKVTEAKGSDHALVVFHHWNARSRKPQLAHFFAHHGVTVVEMALPYHMERSRPGAAHADDILSPNLGRTLRSIRQAVLDGRQLIAILKAHGYGSVSVLGMSLGSWVAGLVAAHDEAVERAALFLTAGRLADMVWTGRATRHIRASLDGKIDQADLRRAWGPLDLGLQADRLSRPDLDLLIVLAKRDEVVLPSLSEDLVAKLSVASARQQVMRLNCGHYSLSMPPFILQAGFGVLRLLKREP